MKIIIYGINDVSYLIAEAFNNNHDITIIDDVEELPSEFEKLDVGFVAGNATSPQTLMQAGVMDANLFIGAAKLDEANIVATWTAKKLSDIKTVAFVSKVEYFRNFKNSQYNPYFEEMGIDYILLAQGLLVQEIFRIIIEPEAIDVEYLEDGKARLFEYRIKEDSPILNKELKDCSFPEETIIVGIVRDDNLFIPGGSTVLKLNDKTIFMGTERALQILSRDYFFKKTSCVKTVAIIGGGDVGYMLASHLENLGISVKIVEKKNQRCEFLSEKLQKSLVLHADGSDIEFLESEEIAQSDVVVVVTNNDEKNLLCSLILKQLGASRVITRVNNDDIVNLFEKVGVDVTISPNIAIVNELKNKIIEKSSNILLTVEQDKADVVEMEVPEKFCDKQIKSIHFPVKAIVGIIKRGKKILIPKGDTLVREGDLMIIFTKSDDVQNLKEFMSK